MRRSLFGAGAGSLALAVVALAGCEVKRRSPAAKGAGGAEVTTASSAAPTAPVDTSARAADPLWQAARERLWSDPDLAWGRDLAYMNRDPALVDAVLERTIAQRLRGVSPRDEGDLERLVQLAAQAFRMAQTATPEARAALEALLRADYERPEVRVEHGKAIADVGLVPGTFVRGGRGGGWELEASPELVDRHEWRASEVARFLQRVAAGAASPLREIQLEVEIPRYGSVRRLRYAWDLPGARIVVNDVGSDLLKFAPVPGGDLGPLLAGERTLLMRDLEIVPQTPDW